MLTLKHGLPIPETTFGRSAKYPWASMEIGDSFLVLGKMTNDLSPVANYQSKKRGTSYTCRLVDGGVRVWRVA
jgi:hypothetical protein